jgi:hypothetical protein
MITRTYGPFIFYQSMLKTRPQAMVYSHGAFDRRKKPTTAVPSDMNVYFYSTHGTSTSNQMFFPLLKNEPAQGNIKDLFQGKLPIMTWGAGSVTSIAGPGAIIYDYELSWNNKYVPLLEAFKKAVREVPDYPKDFILVDEAQKKVPTSLSALFAIMAKFGMAYEILHFMPCRVPGNQRDEFTPTDVNPEGTFNWTGGNSQLGGGHKLVR